MRYPKVLFETLKAATIGAACLLISACYVTEQGTRYLSIRSKAIPVAKALADSKTAPEVRALLERVAEVRVFASEKLGLKQTKNYTSIVMTDRDHLADIVSACAELSFNRYLWSYPLVGKLPYQGYFTLSEAQAESSRLKKKGLDTLVRQVDAFSTLGWLKDPLFSFMSSYSEADIADLIIHESTHATVFVNGYTDFDEELAVFVGGQGALLWLESKYGKDSPQVTELRKDRADDAAFTAWLRGTAAQLEKLYTTRMDDAESGGRRPRSSPRARKRSSPSTPKTLKATDTKIFTWRGSTMPTSTSTGSMKENPNSTMTISRSCAVHRYHAS